MTSPYRHAARVSLVVAVAAFAGCSGGGTPAAQQSTPAESTPAQSASAEPTPEPTTTEPATPDSVIELTTDNLFDTLLEAQSTVTSSRIESVVSAEGQQITMSGATKKAADGSTDLMLVMTTPDTGEVEVRVVGGAWFMRIDGLTEGKFVAVDPADPSGAFAGMADVVDELDPTANTDAVREALVSVTKVGPPEELDGVLTQSYDVVLDPMRITGEIADAMAELGDLMPETLTYRYWVDAEGRTRKMVTEMMGTRSETTYSAFGEPVDIVAPGPDEILETS